MKPEITVSDLVDMILNPPESELPSELVDMIINPPKNDAVDLSDLVQAIINTTPETNLRNNLC